MKIFSILVIIAKILYANNVEMHYLDAWEHFNFEGEYGVVDQRMGIIV